MSSRRREILVTSALPYANGAIHIGHLVEYVQTDIWARYMRMAGHEVTYVCASDAHGTPVMLKAREEGIAPEVLVERFRAEHQRDFAAFGVAFDNYHTTHSEENRLLVEQIYQRLEAGGLIERRDVEQAYDAEAGMFLPDRFVRGTCPACGAPDQYGDSCEACGATYSPSDLLDPRSVVSGTTPVRRSSEHFFFRLAAFTDSLRAWLAGGAVGAQIAQKLEEWFAAGLRDWDISRDAPYFGFRIPGTRDKYFYVWLDAPVGYLASLRQYCGSEAGRSRGLEFERYASPASPTEMHHFIGKDIAYFHTLFWPAVLEASGFRRPTAVHVHGFLTVNGQKMSKSRGTFISAATWLEHLDPEALRYYYAFKLGSGIDDIDLNLEDFVARVNADLVGKFVNLASRCAGFISRGHGGMLAAELDDLKLYQRFVEAGESIGRWYEAREYGRAMREIMRLADQANRYIDEHKPWQLARDPAQAARVQQVCTQGLNLFRVLMIYLAPVLPLMASRAQTFLGGQPLDWADRARPLLSHPIAAYEPLMSRVETAAITRMLEHSRAAPQAAPPSGSQPAPPADGDEMITIDDFLKVELRIATVLEASEVEGADRLLRLVLDAGAGEQRTVFSGIRAGYDAAQLAGRQVILVANLQPRKMRFGISEGMVLAAADGEQLFLVGPDAPAPAGARVS
ncbi:MAG: methionine--tRNA ligase [Chromatiales bacterium]|nr:methionine--tRNA ligase [Chromatiales bacterium]